MINKERAKKVLMLLDRLNKEIDLLGGAIHKNKLNPIPVITNGKPKGKFN